MSSRTSRRMGLRGLVLGGAVAVSSFSLSGCWAAIAGAYVYAHQVDKTNEANKEAARIQADAIRDAARTQAGNNNSNGAVRASYAPQGSQTERDIVKYGSNNVQFEFRGYDGHLLFACSSVKDFNNDRVFDTAEVFGVNNSFTTENSVFIVSKSKRRINSYIRGQYFPKIDYFLVNQENGIILEKCEGVSLHDSRSYDPGSLKPGNYRVMYSLEGKGIFNSLDFSVKESSVVAGK